MSFEDWLATDYKRLWHEAWQEGRIAHEQGIPREDNPHRLKVWKEAWGYGWDDYDPHDELREFQQVEQHLQSLPTRLMQDSDI